MNTLFYIVWALFGAALIFLVDYALRAYLRRNQASLIPPVSVPAVAKASAEDFFKYVQEVYPDACIIGPGVHPETRQPYYAVIRASLMAQALGTGLTMRDAAEDALRRIHETQDYTNNWRQRLK